MKYTIYKTNTKDPRYLSGELVGITKGIKHTEETKKKIGKTNSVKQSGKGNSQYSTCWIYNLKLKENKKISKDNLQEWLNKGWIKGRKMKF